MSIETTPQLPVRHVRRWSRRARSFLDGRRQVWSVAMLGVLVVAGAIAWVKYPRQPLPLPVRGKFPQSTVAMRSPGKIRVLFLGNSLTNYNGGIATFMEQLAASAKTHPTPVFDQLTRYGATWAQLWDITDARELIHQGGWDFVVLQDYSSAAIIYPAEMQIYGRRFSNEIHNIGATPVFFLTWPHENDLGSLSTIGTKYTGLAAGNRGIVAPAGLAWKTVHDQNPQIKLYDSRDKAPVKHPSQEGTYLTACVFYSMFFNKSPVGLTGRIVEGTNVYADLIPDVAEYLQQVAWDTVKNAGSIASTQPTTNSRR